MIDTPECCKGSTERVARHTNILVFLPLCDIIDHLQQRFSDGFVALQESAVHQDVCVLDRLLRLLFLTGFLPEDS